MKPKYKYKPKRAILDEEGNSYRAFSELDFESGSGLNSNHITPLGKGLNKKNKAKPKRDIKALVNKFFDVPEKSESSN